MPEIPPVPGRAGLTAKDPDTFEQRVLAAFSPEGPLATRLPDFEPRAAQLEMASAVARVFEEAGILIVEAGTGTGKTLGYLVPAILSRQRVLVSTGTKNLQEQIFFKDIPALRDALGVPFTAAYMKGRANYLCLHRLDQIEGQAQTGDLPAKAGSYEDRSGSYKERGRRHAPRGARLDDQVFLPIIREWSARTKSGDRAELPDLPEDLPFWDEVSAKADTCLGTECPRYDDCFVTRMRQEAAAADIVIVNHHLLCADAAVRQNAYGEVLPACSHAVIDEAHQLEDVATQYFGFSVSNYRVEDLVRDVERVAASAAVADVSRVEAIGRAVAQARDASQSFFYDVTLAHRALSSSDFKKEERVRATASSFGEAADSARLLSSALDAIEVGLTLAAPRADGDEPATVQEDVVALARRAGQLRDELKFVLRASDADFVYFVERRGKGIHLRASPIDVSAIVRDVLLDRMRTTVLTSATLSVDGTFEHVRARLGVGHAGELRLTSEFDFARQALMYLPPRMPDPRSPEFPMAAARQVIEILKRTEGRAFVLFTSYATLRAVQNVVEMALEFPLLVQGTLPRSQLLRQFRETPHSVLFATASFWQGVDVVGDALSCVIVDKLPFVSPGDPITAARIEAVRERGGEPFGEYQVPLAILALQQGLGRLIRHRKDRGVLAVLDPRLLTKGYGRRFVNSLPPAPITRDLAAIDAFFRGGEAPGAADLVNRVRYE